MVSFRTCVAGFSFGLIALIGASPAVAAPVVSFSLSRDDGVNPVATWADAPTGSGGGPVYNFAYDVNSSNNTSGWDFDWVVSADPDPILTSNLTLQNTSAFTQTFTSLLTLPISPAITGSSLIGGSVGGSVTDGNGLGSGALLSTVAGSALYTAFIDGVSVQTLYPHPFTVNVVGNFQTLNVPATDFGTPIPSQPGPAALSTISIQYKFTLSPGDSVALTGVFVVEPVPEPAMLSVFGLAGLTLLARRRRAA